MTNKTVIWRTDTNNTWRLYTNTTFKLVEAKPPKDSKNKSSQDKSQTRSQFLFTKIKPMTKGAIVCTSMGYGSIQAFNEDKKTITVKVEGQTQILPEEEVLIEIPLNLVFLNNSLRMEEVQYVPISYSLNEMVEKLVSSVSDEDSFHSLDIFFKGKKLETSSETLEKLRIMPWSKILAVSKFKEPKCIQRYKAIFGGWTLHMNTLGLSFMPSKTVRIAGFGLYKPAKGTMMATAHLYVGSSIKGEEIWSKDVEVGQGANKEDIERIMFSKPYTLREGEFASVTIAIKAQFESYYGNGALPTVEAEGDVTFTFKLVEGLPYANEVSEGQFPELYYYA